jgi:DNA-3-methyladenine glycosylase II
VPTPSFRAATERVASIDPALARVIERAGPVRFPRRSGDPFDALIQAIVYQQLAGAAAAAIHGRFLALFDGALPTPARVVALPEEDLRGVGLSGAKAASIHDLAAKVLDGTVPLDDVRGLADDDLVARLVQVRGIGRWTAEMFLIFQLHRPDVWPVDDLGVRRGWQLAHELPEIPSARGLELEGEAFRPVRTTAAWYSWRAVHLSRGQP